MKTAFKQGASPESMVTSKRGGEQDSERQKKKKEVDMLEALIVILIIGWALGLFAFHVGGLIHVLLVIALIVLIVRLLQGKKIL